MESFALQNFVKFVTQPENHLTGIETELRDPKEELRLSQRKPWQSYSRDCLVCSPGKGILLTIHPQQIILNNFIESKLLTNLAF